MRFSARLAVLVIAIALTILIESHRHAPTSPSPSMVALGETVTVSNGVWPCGSTTEALDALLKWAAAGDNQEMMRTMHTTGSFAVEGGMSVKILDVGFLKRRIRVLTDAQGTATHTDKEGAYSDPRVGRECWVISEALK